MAFVEIDQRIIAGSDDVSFHDLDDSAITTSELQVGYDVFSGGIRHGIATSLKFTNITIPTNSVVIGAYIELNPYTTGSLSVPGIVDCGFGSLSSNIFSNMPFEFTNTGKVIINITSGLKLLPSKAGWTGTGNINVLFWYDNSDTTLSAGTHVSYHSYETDYASDSAPRLMILYESEPLVGYKYVQVSESSNDFNNSSSTSLSMNVGYILSSFSHVGFIFSGIDMTPEINVIDATVYFYYESYKGTNQNYKICVNNDSTPSPTTGIASLPFVSAGLTKTVSYGGLPEGWINAEASAGLVSDLNTLALRSDWVQGNNVMIVFLGVNTDGTTQYFAMTTFDSKPSRAPILVYRSNTNIDIALDIPYSTIMAAKLEQDLSIILRTPVLSVDNGTGYVILNWL